MRALSIPRRFHVRRSVIPTMLAAATSLAGCAVDTTPGIGRSTSPCRTSAVLYCELAPHADRCRCFGHDDLRDMLRSLSRR